MRKVVRIYLKIWACRFRRWAESFLSQSVLFGRCCEARGPVKDKRFASSVKHPVAHPGMATQVSSHKLKCGIFLLNAYIKTTFEEKYIFYTKAEFIFGYSNDSRFYNILKCSDWELSEESIQNTGSFVCLKLNLEGSIYISCWISEDHLNQTASNRMTNESSYGRPTND